MRNETLVKTFIAAAPVAPFRLVKLGAADGQATQAAAVTDAIFGVSNLLGADATGDRFDVVMAGIAEIEYGDTVTRGDWLTTDADGKAVAAAPATGANNSVIGRAMTSGVAGDIGSVFIAPGSLQG